MSEPTPSSSSNTGSAHLPPSPSSGSVPVPAGWPPGYPPPGYAYPMPQGMEIPEGWPQGYPPPQAGAMPPGWPPGYPPPGYGYPVPATASGSVPVQQPVPSGVATGYPVPSSAAAVVQEAHVHVPAEGEIFHPEAATHFDDVKPPHPFVKL